MSIESDGDHRMVALKEIGLRLGCYDELLAALKDAESIIDALAEDGHMNEYRRKVWARMREAIDKAERSRTDQTAL